MSDELSIWFGFHPVFVARDHSFVSDATHPYCAAFGHTGFWVSSFLDFRPVSRPVFFRDLFG
jgi:hypothetical protein